MLGKNDALVHEDQESIYHELLIVSHVQLFTESISAAINGDSNLSIVGRAGDLPEILIALRAYPTATVLLDAALPGGADILRAVHEARPSIPVIIFPLEEEEETIVAWVRAGATGYIPSTATVHAIPQYVEAVLRGEQMVSGAVASGLMRRIRTSINPDDNPGAPRNGVSLTCRESEIVKMIAAGSSNKEIARRLKIELSTTKSHVHNLLSKLGLQSRGQVAYWARMHDGRSQ